ncbi:MAG: galactose-1-phosphate uridylyltransferase [Nitrospinae bacterium]|nr:galactose-1-phosphate uridylyltransferase [Nitrospinota bacterium]MDA1108628.1 galactose-1-phosphate uridylyltransferase [Nitrospinota bacterium]
MPELRKDPILNRWVIISPERGQRPQDFPPPEKKLHKASCAFCQGNESTTPPEILAFRPENSLPNTPGWTLRVVPNKFPALKIEDQMDRSSDGLYEMMNGIGAHEVIIESPDHEADLDLLPEKKVEDALWTFKYRILDLKKDTRFQYILIFKNHGEAAGATLEHSHCQLIALPIVPELVSDEIAGAQRHFVVKNRCIFCDIIAQEKAVGLRIVNENDRFITLCPYAPRFPFEMWLLPKFHSDRFEDCAAEDISCLASLLKESLMKMRYALEAPSYNFVLHTSPVNGDHGKHYHWHIEIMPKLTKMAGFEQGTGFYINPVLPEVAAETLRNTQLPS